MSHKLILWEVDTQADFMLPGGKLHVPGAEKLLPNLRRLTDMARSGRALLISHGCYHTPDDPEFQTFPPHCVKGTPGAEYVPEAWTGNVAVIPNEPSAALPPDFSRYRQIHLEKQTLDVFQTLHADELVKRLPQDADFAVFGVVTEYCVRFAAKGLLERGRKVFVVHDAIETLNAEDGSRTRAELERLGASFISTGEVLSRVKA